jgi:hypothetical protein
MKFFTLALMSFILNISLASAANEIGFLCTANVDGFGGSFKLKTVLKGYLVKKQKGAVLSGYDFKYKVLDGNYVWSEANVSFDTDLENDSDYKPRKYKNHYKFDISKDIFGFVNFLVPFEAFNSSDDRFKAVLIMTSIDDHAGDTVHLNCSID